MLGISSTRGLLLVCLYVGITLYLIVDTSALLGLGKGKPGKGKGNQTKPGKGHHHHHHGNGGGKESATKDEDEEDVSQRWKTYWMNYFKNKSMSEGGGNKSGTSDSSVDFQAMMKDFPDPKKSIRFFLRDRKGQSWVEIKNNNGSVPSQWQTGQPIKIIIHGYSEKADTFVNSSDHTKIFKMQNVHDIGMNYGKEHTTTNVINMDWAAFAGGKKATYDLVVGYVPMVGDILSGFLIDLEKAGHLKNYSEVHLIGYCMGAHVAGVAGKLISELAGSKVARITGLDPANAGFDDADGTKMMDDDLALTKEDATFVDIIHCNMGQVKDDKEAISKSRFGSVVQSGHVDFYPNGGETQKECKPEEDGSEKYCSSRKCPTYFAKSIKQQKFLGCLCDDYEEYEKGNCECKEEEGGTGSLMGDKVFLTASGRYYLAIPEKS